MRVAQEPLLQPRDLRHCGQWTVGLYDIEGVRILGWVQKVGPNLREWFRQVEAYLVINRGKKIHQTWEFFQLTKTAFDREGTRGMLRIL